MRAVRARVVAGSRSSGDEDDAGGGDGRWRPRARSGRARRSPASFSPVRSPWPVWTVQPIFELFYAGLPLYPLPSTSRQKASTRAFHSSGTSWKGW
jgi:hypothetical protein